MSSFIRRQIARRRPTGSGSGSLNLVPLIDVLTSIVFFGLLTYAGSRSATLTAFDLAVAPASGGVTGASGAEASRVELMLRVDRRGVTLTRAGGGERRFEGFSDETLARLNRAVAEYGRGTSAASSVSVIPADDLNYDDLIRVLDQVRMAGQSRIALGIRPRA
jgi:biopolymer transport protein ExbD